MDPQKFPTPNKPEEDAKKTSPTDASDISMSEESSVPPGTIVVGGPANPDTDMGPKPPEAPTEPAVPTPDTDQSNMAAFMREPADSSETPPVPPKGKKMGLIIGVVAAVLLVFAGGAAAYFAFMKPSPDKVLQTALVNTFSKDKVQTVGFESEIAITDTASNTTYTVDLTGATGQNGALALTGNVKIPMLTPVTLDARSADGKTLFFKASGLADVAALLQTDPSTALYAPLLADLDNQWYKIDPSLLEQLGASAPSTTGITDADRQKLADAYTQNQFLTVQETLADEKIAGVDSYHYKVGIDGVKLKAFLSAVETAKIESLGLTQPLLDSMKNGADDVDFSKYPLDVWIAKDSKLFTQFGFKMQDNEASLDMKLTLKDYNKSVTVEEPADAQPIMNVVNSFYQTLFGGLGSDVPDNLLQ